MIDLQQFHFLRPLWLFAAAPAIALAVALWRQPGSGANWRRAIAPDLLDHLLDSSRERRNGWAWLALAGWLLATLALAGPAWEKLPQPVLQKRDALAIVLDLSLSMYAEDVKPSRLQRARFKILDALQRRSEGLTGLVVYSGDAHVVSPLTDDSATIANLVPSLAPSMMPAYGSDPVAGVDLALQLLRNAGFERGRVLLISDEITDANIDALAQRFGDDRWQLSILGVGTDQGAPIPVAADTDRGAQSGGFLKQPNGQIVVAQLHRERFERLAGRVHGTYSDLQADDRDLDALLPGAAPREDETRHVQRQFDQWRERGVWLAMALLPLAALAFRRGWLLLVLVAPLALPPTATAAETPAPAVPGSAWRDWWLRADQQGQQALDAGDAQAAAEKFRDPARRGAALYRAGDYAAAAQALQGLDDADAAYNRGNALARAGQLQEALAAYDVALAREPQSADAKANRALVEKLLKQQQQNPQQQSQQNGQQDSQQKHQPDSQQDQQQTQGGNGQQHERDGQQGQSQQPGDKPQGDNDKPQGDKGSPQGDDAASRAAGQAPESSAQDASAGAQADAASPQDAQARRNDDKPADGRAQQQPAAAKPQDAADNRPQQATAQESSEQQRQQRATEQWLRQIPDDPGGLLRRKFLYEHRQRERDAPPADHEQPLW